MLQSRLRIIFHCKDKTDGGDGGQWRGCQQCTLGKDGEKPAVKPVTTLSKPASLGLVDSGIVVPVYKPANKRSPTGGERGLCSLGIRVKAHKKRVQKA